MNSRLFASRAPLVFVPMGACKPYIPFTGRQCADRTPPAFFSQCAARACLGPLCAAPIGRRTAVPGGPAPHRGGAFASPLYRKAAGNSSRNCPLPFCLRLGWERAAVTANAMPLRETGEENAPPAVPFGPGMPIRRTRDRGHCGASSGPAGNKTCLSRSWGV